MNKNRSCHQIPHINHFAGTRVALWARLSRLFESGHQKAHAEYSAHFLLFVRARDKHFEVNAVLQCGVHARMDPLNKKQRAMNTGQIKHRNGSLSTSAQVPFALVDLMPRMI